MKYQRLGLSSLFAFTSVLVCAQNSTKINAGLLLPFHSDTASSLNDRQISEATLDYYAGMRLAIEDLSKWNIQVNLKVWDLKNFNEDALVKLPKSKDFQQLDVFFGPFTQKPVDLISSNLQHTNFLWVSPLKTLKLPKTVESINFFSHDSTRVSGLFKLLKQDFPTHRICLVYDNKKTALLPYYRKYAKRYFKEFNECLLSNGKLNPKAPKEESILLVNVGTSSFTRLAQYPVVAKKYDSYIIGALDWYDNVIPAEEVNEIKICYPSVNYINGLDSQVLAFTQSFVLKERAEPSKFAFQGYDQMWIVGVTAANKGNCSFSGTPNATYDGLINSFRIKEVSSNHFENQGIRLIKTTPVELQAWDEKLDDK